MDGDEFKDSGVSGEKPAQVEGFAGWKFLDVYNPMNTADADVAPNHTTKWSDIGNAIRAARGDFNSSLSVLLGGDAAKGDTARAVWDNINSSLKAPDSIATDAKRMSIIVDAFSRCIGQTRQQIVDNYEGYLDAVRRANAAYRQSAGVDNNVDSTGTYSSTNHTSAETEQYDKFARGLMHNPYAEGIEKVASNHPDVARDAPPNITPVNVPGGPAGGPSVGGPSVGGPSVGGPSVKTPSIPTAKDLQQVSKSANPSTDPSKSLGDAAKGVSDAANSAGGAATDAAGKASDALNQALGSLGSLGSQTPDGLNPDKLSGLGGVPIGGLHPTGTPRGTGGGPSGAGAGPTLPKTAANPALAASPTKATAAAPVSRAGISTQGSPGAAGGAPAAGTRQGGAAGTVHKVNKALNNRKNGSEIVAQADAVVAVVGEEAKPEQTTKPIPS
ncbi:hypothetical protein HBE99_19615 [Mycobacteroides chelonae]|uniref:hypothetical protein n=1 Tax=Mycobacteroides chelonae TaxID=1774 RepID=UPI0019103E7A|nr:hypothetical protein [Mycobacteroides chelonae]QQG98786.1 hypothetical protein HBE99_19615 [Mycobacteroides chelonae]